MALERVLGFRVDRDDDVARGVREHRLGRGRGRIAGQGQLDPRLRHGLRQAFAGGTGTRQQDGATIR